MPLHKLRFRSASLPLLPQSTIRLVSPPRSRAAQRQVELVVRILRIEILQLLLLLLRLLLRLSLRLLRGSQWNGK